MKRRPSKNGVSVEKKNALIVDGNSLLKFGFHGAKDEYNYFGEHIGGLYQFLTILRKLLDSHIYHNVFVFWDGPLSGKMRYDIYKDYKGNRDKNFETGTFSQDADLVRQKKLVWNYLEQFCIRQLEDYVIESDDYIGYFCKTKSEEYNITICTIDRDMAQLINDSVRIYFCDLRTMVTLDNYNEFFHHHQSNALLIKILAGDNGDNINGVKGVKEPLLLKYFPVLAERETSLEEIINIAKSINEERINNKKKPIQALENIVEGITEGSQGKHLYEINRVIMDLKKPLLTNSGILKFEDVTTLPIDPEGRSIKNIFNKIRENGLDGLINERQFVNYMLPFKRIMNKEKENYYRYNGDDNFQIIEE